MRERTHFLFPYLLVFDQPNNPIMWVGKNNFIQFRTRGLELAEVLLQQDQNCNYRLQVLYIHDVIRKKKVVITW